MPTRTKKPARRSTRKTSTKSHAKKAAQPRFGAGVWMRLPVLDQRDFDLIGLALTALGVFMASVVYLDWGGGDVGEALVLGFSRAIGLMVYALPVALVVAGALVVMRPFLASGRPFGSGGACLFTALALGLAAGTLGIGPGGARAAVWDSAFVEPRGGLFGQALYTLAERAVSDVGAHILAVFLFAAGVLLLTGATIAGVVHTTRSGRAGHEPAPARIHVRAGLGAVAPTRGGRPRTCPRRRAAVPPEPERRAGGARHPRRGAVAGHRRAPGRRVGPRRRPRRPRSTSPPRRRRPAPSRRG